MRKRILLAFLAMAACSPVVSEPGDGGDAGGGTGNATGTCPSPPEGLEDVPCNGTIPGADNASLQGTGCANVGESCECHNIDQCPINQFTEYCIMTCSECHLWDIVCTESDPTGYGGGGMGGSSGVGGAGGQ